MKISLYECLNAKVLGDKISCSKGHNLGAANNGTVHIRRLMRGELLIYIVCQDCADFDRNGQTSKTRRQGMVIQMKDTSRCREKVEGWTGRRRNYICRRCGEKFQHDGGRLPKGGGFCPSCLEDPDTLAVFHKAFEEEEERYENSLYR